MERTTLAVLAFAAFAAMAFLLLRRAEAGYQGIANFTGRSALSTSSFFDPATTVRNAVDGDPNTYWAKSFPVSGRLCAESSGSPSSSPVERPPCLFLQTDAGFTHSPGSPPQKSPLGQIRIITPGRAYARPRQVRIVFFAQEIVDMDREFRLPPLPEFLAERTATLQDQEEVSIDTDFLPPPLDSPRYPIGVRRLQVRIEIRDVYPGTEHANTVAISEVTYSHRAP